MARPRLRAGGGLAAVGYVLRKGREAGGLLRLYRRLRSRNACKTCALGMGGQRGGMVNEAGHFPEVCKKSVQAQAGDMAAPIAEAFFRRTPLATLEGQSSAELERLGRLGFPLLAEANDTHFRRISWAEALDRAGAGLRAAPPEEVFFYSSGRSSNEAAFLMQLVARAFGTQNVHNCSFYCHNASGVALGRVYGSGTASLSLADLASADLALVAGANPASNHPRLITQLVELRRRGGKVIVVNPLRELGLLRFRVPSDWRSMLFGSTVSDLYLQPHVGADVALFKALLKGVVEAGGLDREYVAASTTGWDGVEADMRAVSWDALLAAAGVSRAEIDQAVALLCGARRGVFMWAMGLTHHAHGVDNVLALANLALARGWLGREGSGLLPVRGHSNVQGVGTCGVTPALKAGFAAKLEALYGIPVRAGVGQDTYASMVAAGEGRIRAALLLGGNLFASNPDRRWAATALRRIGLSVSVTTKLNEGHVHGRGRTALVLPCLARDEEHEATTQESMFNFVRLSEGGTPAIAGEMRSEVEIIAALAELILPAGRFDWTKLRSHRELRHAIAAVVPGMAPLAAIDAAGGEFQIGGRTFREPRFPTPDGRAHFHVTPLPDFAPGPDELRLTTLRSEGQFNTVVYDEEDVYRGNRRRDVVMMAAADASRLGLAEGERAVVETAAGRLEVSVAIVDLRPGNLAMYYPEANELVPRRLDPQAKTPAFKSVVARVRRAARAVAAAVLLVALGGALPARAHDIPIFPSTCTFEAIELSAPAVGPGLAAIPATDADRFRIIWDTATTGAQFDLRGVPPRALFGAATTGSLAFPPVFHARLLASGDLTTAPLPLALTRDGGPVTTLSVALTTALAGQGELQGAPLGPDARFTLVGEDAVAGYTVSLTCQPAPAPDLDQFHPVAESSRAAAVLDGSCAAGSCPRDKVRVRFALADPGVPDVSGVPVRLRLAAGSDLLGTAAALEGLVRQDQIATATTPQGGTIVLRALRGGAVQRFVLTVAGLRRPPSAQLPKGGRAELTYEVGGLVGRGSATLRVR